MKQSEKHNKSLAWRQTKGKELLGKLNFERKYETLSGTNVRNRSEKRIADFLHKKSITFEYEKRLWLNNKVYYPDFFLPDFNIYIEFFGWSHIPTYQDKVNEKKSVYRENNVRCIYLYHKGSKYLEENLEKELKKLGILNS